GELDRLNQLPAALLDVLPEGFTTEVGPRADQWWRSAAQCLRAGRMVTFDYGLDAEEFLSPQRALGTLRSFARHRMSDDLLACPGDQDLTAHVNFSRLINAGERAGLTTEAFAPQLQWLTELLARQLNGSGQSSAWNSRRVRQFQTLTHPEHLGR